MNKFDLTKEFVQAYRDEKYPRVTPVMLTANGILPVGIDPNHPEVQKIIKECQDRLKASIVNN